MCGVPYGVIDVDRLLASLTVVAGPDGAPALALHDKGLAALESLLFAKYQMYRNVYWHHAVRAATVMFTRLVRVALAGGRLRVDDIALATDEGLIYELQREDTTGLAHALRERRLAKRALDVPATELPADTAAWPADDPDLRSRVEDRVAAELGLAEHELFLDFPAKPDMLALDLPLVKRDGTVTHLAGAAAAEHLGLPGVAVGFGDEGVDLLLRRPARLEHLDEVGILDHPCQAVGSQEEQVHRLQGPRVHVRNHVAVRADAARDHVAVRMRASLIRRQVA